MMRMYTWTCFLILFGVSLVHKCAANNESKLNVVDWDGKYDKKTCFKAHMAIEFYSKYNTTENSTKPVLEAVLSFTDKKELTVSNCTNTSLVMVIKGTESEMLTLVFEANDKDFWLVSAEIKFTVSNKNFVNSTDLNQTVTAKTKFDSRMKTPLGSSYSCSMESQFALKQTNASNSLNGMYLRFAVNEKDKVTLQAINVTEKAEEQKCFSDLPLPEPTLNSWDVTEKKTKCALMNTTLKLEVMYNSISGEEMTAKIPLTTATKVKGGMCSSNKTNITVSLERGAGTLSFIFLTKSSSFYYSSDDMYSLDTMDLTYDPSADYFPNHVDSDKGVVSKRQSKLAMFSAPVGKSYRCDAMTEANVTKSVKAMFNSTRLQPFAVKNATFSEASNCAAEPTTQPITTKPIIPVITNPNITDRVIRDSKNNTCLHAYIGLQFQTNYKVKGSNKSEIARFNFNQGEVTQTATCNGTNAVVTFDNEKYSQILTLTFTKDSKSGMKRLSNVMLNFNITNYFANASEIGKNFHHSISVNYFELQKNTSYKCNSTETDILLDNDDRVILRIVGLQIEPFPVASKFAPARKCFSDLPVPKVTEGSWYINETGKNNSICAHFNFASFVNISYSTLLSDEPVYLKIPIDGKKHNASESFGKCEGNMTTLMLDMDKGNIKFTFTFHKKNISKSNYRYSMKSFKMVYNINSEYFPNHDYIEGNMVTLTNQSLDLFESNQDHSYKCDAKSVAYLNKTKMAVTFTDVQVQPFGVKDDGSFLTADDCAADEDLSPLIPIIVGAILAGLVVIVLIAYIIGRRRNSNPAYETI